MKLWVKFLIGSLIGVLCAFLLPSFSAYAAGGVALCAKAVVRLGRYTVVPLVFSSAFIAIYRLREEHTYIKCGLWIIAVITASAVLLTALALASAMLVPLPRLNIAEAQNSIQGMKSAVAGLAAGGQTALEPPLAAGGLQSIASMLFPSSAFSALCNGECVAAAFLAGAFAGGAAQGDKDAFKPLITVFDSLSVLCYNIVTLFYEFIPIGAVALAWKCVLDLRFVKLSVQAGPIVLLLAADLCLAAFVLYPLLLALIAHEKHPYRVLYAALAPLLAAALSGDVNFCLPLVMRMGSEDFGVRRRVNASVCPIFVSFARAGSAVVAIVCFVAVWHSYSSLPIPPSGIVRLALLAGGMSFALSGMPFGGAFVVFTAVCTAFGQEFEAGSAVLLPCAALFSSIAAMFDVLTCAFGLVLIANKTHTMKARYIKDFI